MIKSSNPNNSITNPDKLDEDKINETNLRPKNFKDFIGQKIEIDKLKVYIQATQNYNILFYPKAMRKLTMIREQTRV